jgi:hypothetical protein
MYLVAERVVERDPAIRIVRPKVKAMVLNAVKYVDFVKFVEPVEAGKPSEVTTAGRKPALCWLRNI